MIWTQRLARFELLDGEIERVAAVELISVFRGPKREGDLLVLSAELPARGNIFVPGDLVSVDLQHGLVRILDPRSSGPFHKRRPSTVAG